MDEIKLVKYLSAELSDNEIKEVELWLEIPKNKIEFERINQLWENSSNFQNVELFQADKNWNNMKQRMDSLQQKSHKERNIQIFRYAIAASLIVIFGISAFFFIQSTKSKNNIQFVAGNEKQEKPVILPDGTSVYLNRNTHLSYDESFNKKSRVVTLTGEAYFDVAKNPKKPFIIRTASTEIKVVGTSFNVMAYANSDSVQVLVQSGIVEMYSKSDKKSTLRLTVGNEGTYVKSDEKLKSQNGYDTNMLAWKTHQLNFDNADMTYVVSALEHAFGKKILFDPIKLKNCRLRTDFDNKSLDTILSVIKESLGIKVSIDGDVFTLSGPGCK